MFVEERFRLPEAVKIDLRSRQVPWGFGPLSETVYHRTYSRDGEAWADTIIRVVEGVMSIRKDWLVRVMGKRWNAQKYDLLAVDLAYAMFEMRMLPPGRGLWAMGTEYVYERGSHALNNCACVEVSGKLASAAEWLMDSLMCGVGVGFTLHTAKLKIKLPSDSAEPRVWTVPDTKEGWAESVRLLINSYESGGRRITFDYSAIRPAGALINGFGGVSSGSGPLKKLHERLRPYLEDRAAGRTTDTRLIADTMNAIGACVVAGNVRRSAEIAVGSAQDAEFYVLKDYERYPERAEIGWMSNNTVALRTRDDFSVLPLVAERVRDNGEPGVLNLMNVHKYGRIGERHHDDAIGINPCGEIPLESHELCNLVEVFPTRAASDEELFKTMSLATFYASTVALLKSHREETNDVVSRNRRIGVSVSGIADWLDMTSVSHVFDVLNRGYEKVIRPTNKALAREAGVAESIRVTTVKPSGTVSLLAGVSPGMHFPVSGYVLRRVRVGQASPIADALIRAGVPHEADAVSDNTTVFEFPLQYGSGRTRPVDKVSVYEQAAVVAMLQRCWADNAVSNTLTVQPDEMDQIERVLALFAPQVKSLSLLPDKSEMYEQLPIERITKHEFTERQRKLQPINWSEAGGALPKDAPAYCESDRCEI